MRCVATDDRRHRGCRKPKAGTKDKEALQGLWQAVAVEVNGENKPVNWTGYYVGTSSLIMVFAILLKSTVRVRSAGYRVTTGVPHKILAT